MKMTKRIFAVALSYIAAFSLAACGGKKDDTAKAKDVVAKFMTAIKNADVEGIKKNVDKKHADELKDNGTESQRERMKKFLSKSAATFKSGEIKKDSTTGELKFEITHLKLTTEKMLKLGKNPKPEDVNKLETGKTEITVKFVKEGEEWKISNPEELLRTAMGMKSKK